MNLHTRDLTGMKSFQSLIAHVDSYQQLTCSKLSSVCACYTLKEDNFVVLQVVYETENSKLNYYPKEPRLGYSRY